MFLLTSTNLLPSAVAGTIERIADTSLRMAEMNHGDTLRYRLLNGQTRSFVLEGTRARIVESPWGGILYSFEWDFRADGQPVTLRRFVRSQETFYEPSRTPLFSGASSRPTEKSDSIMNSRSQPTCLHGRHCLRNRLDAWLLVPSD